MKFYFSIGVFLLFAQASWAQTTLSGKVVDLETAEELISATIQVFQNGSFQQGEHTDFMGNYNINLDPGTYDVLCTYLGYPDKRVNGVVVEMGKTTALNIEMKDNVPDCVTLVHYDYILPLFRQEPPTATLIQNANTIRRNPSKSIKEMASITPGVSFSN